MIARIRQHTATSRPPVLLVSADEHAQLAEAYRRLMPLGGRLERRLRGVVLDTIESPGSLARAQVVFGMMRAAGIRDAVATEAALAIEYFHTASLLFDDLPSMDNATERRGRACPHILHGPAAVQLAALGFITRGYALLWGVLSTLPARRRARAAALVEECLGLAGILDGQSRDLHFRESDGTPASALEAVRGKTVTLIRLTLLLPAVVAGAGKRVVALLEEQSLHWGLSYQILDDLKDLLLSEQDVGKNIRRDARLGRPNLAVVAGAGAAAEMLRESLERSRGILSALSGRSASCVVLERLQSLLERESLAIGARMAAA